MRYFVAALALLAGSVIAQEVPEEPALIEAELDFSGDVFTCLFRGEVSISPNLVIVTGCPIGPIVCGELVFAEMNTFGPYVEARQCSVTVHRDGFEATSAASSRSKRSSGFGCNPYKLPRI